MSDKVPVVEIVSFALKEGVKPLAGHEEMFGLDPGPNFEGGRAGWQIEDKNTYHWILYWKSLEDHQALMATPRYEPWVSGKILPWCSGPSLFHAELKPYPPRAAFAAPVTEVAKLHIGPEVSKEEWFEGYTKFEEGLRAAAGYKGHSGGWSTDDEKCFIFTIGWETVEAHETFKTSDEGAVWIKYIEKGIAKSEVWHLKADGDVKPPGEWSPV